MYNFIVAQIFGTAGLIFNILSMQMKSKKNILIMFIGLNLSSALSLLFLDSLSGSLICFFAVFETILNYCFDSRNKKVPTIIIIAYIIVNLILGISVFATWIDALPIVCSIIYCFMVYVKQESTIRKLTFSNQTIWLIYDIYVKSYLFSVSNILTIISAVTSMVRFGDFKKIPKKQNKSKK